MKCEKNETETEVRQNEKRQNKWNKMGKTEMR